MELPVVLERLGWVCTGLPRVWTEWESDRQRTDDQGRPMWQVELLVLDGARSAPVRMRVPYEPQLQVGWPVQVSGLSVAFWVSRDGKERVSWTCERVDPVAVSGAEAQQAQQARGQRGQQTQQGQQQ